MPRESQLPQSMGKIVHRHVRSVTLVSIVLRRISSYSHHRLTIDVRKSALAFHVLRRYSHRGVGPFATLAHRLQTIAESFNRPQTYLFVLTQGLQPVSFARLGTSNVSGATASLRLFVNGSTSLQCTAPGSFQSSSDVSLRTHAERCWPHSISPPLADCVSIVLRRISSYSLGDWHTPPSDAARRLCGFQSSSDVSLRTHRRNAFQLEAVEFRIVSIVLRRISSYSHLRHCRYGPRTEGGCISVSIVLRRISSYSPATSTSLACERVNRPQTYLFVLTEDGDYI